MGFDDFVYIHLVHVGVPGAFRVHHADGALFAAIQASRLVDAYFPFTRKAKRFDSELGVIPDFDPQRLQDGRSESGPRSFTQKKICRS